MRHYLIFLLVCICNTLSAQKSMEKDGDKSPIGYTPPQLLKEVVVIAEKRVLKPVDIPAAVSVVSPSSIVGENSMDLRNLSGIIPNFYMQEGGLKLSTPVYVRGVGSVSGVPPVGLYIDGLPIFDKNAFVFDLYDIRQLEVLRGPQTTLYGRNSLNGLINITTNPPGRDFSFQARAGYGSYASRDYRLVSDLPLGNLYNKLAFSYRKSRGYFRNRYDKGRRSNPSDLYNIRYQGLTYTTREWKISWSINYTDSFDGGYAYHVIDSLKTAPYRVNYNTPSSYDRKLLGSHLNLRKIWDKMELRTVSSWSWTKDRQVVDADFTALDVFHNSKVSRQNLFTQEINLQSAGARRLEWTGGLFGFHKDLTNRYLAEFGPDKALLMPLDLDEATYYNNTVNWGLAGYGQITLRELWPGMSFTAGLRYDYENATLTYRDNLRFSGTETFRPFHNDEQEEEYKAWLPKFSLLQKWNRNFSSYLSISKGYKAGGYNIISNDMSSQMVELDYGKEELWNYEIGMKYTNPIKGIRFNAALFFLDWKDQQIFTMGMMGPNIRNAGDARNLGGETDLSWQFARNFTWHIAFGYTRARYYNNIVKEHEDNRIVMAPEFTLNTGIRFNRKVDCRLFRHISASTEVNAMGRQYFDEANTLSQGSYFLWNMEAGVYGKYLQLRVWAKNLLDRHYFTYMLNNPIGRKMPQYNEMGQSGSPVRFGLSLDFKI